MRRFSIVVVLALAACGRAAGGPGAGEERGVCFQGGGCGDGLECWSERCVRPPPADCRAVGDRLASLTLGNYATREEREPAVSKWAAQCTALRLSHREGRCIVEAATEDDIAACPRPLVPELVGDPKGCERLGDHAAGLLEGAAERGGQLAPLLNVLDEVPAAVKALCVGGRWAPEAKACLFQAGDHGAAEKCLALLDGGDRRALERKLTSLVKRGGLGGVPRRPPPGNAVPSECRAFIRMVNAYSTCKAVPPEARAAMVPALKQMESAWKDVNASNRRAMIDGCKSGEEAMRQTLGQLGCTLPAADPWE